MKVFRINASFLADGKASCLTGTEAGDQNPWFSKEVLLKPRDAIVASPGFVFVSADYSQVTAPALVLSVRCAWYGRACRLGLERTISCREQDALGTRRLVTRYRARHASRPSFPLCPPPWLVADGMPPVRREQIEMRLMAHLSGDPELIRVFHEGGDVFRAISAALAGGGKKAQDVSDEDRRKVITRPPDLYEAIAKGSWRMKSHGGAARRCDLPRARGCCKFMD